jgi:D-serine dehydratase
MLKGGIRRLILANEVGGLAGAKRLAGLISAWPLAELYVFVDSLSGLEALAEAWRGELPPLRILLEVGAGRGGVRTLAEAEEIIDAALNARGLILSGVATYEGAAAQPTAEATEEAVAKVLDFTVEVFREIRARESSPRRLIVTAGGSSFFDRVIDRLGPLAAADGNAALILRSGAIFFHDHGMYDLALARLDQRTPSLLAPTVSARNAFRPALRLWAEVLSRPEDALAICGMGMRDVSFDQGMPIVLRVYRSGSLLAGIPTARLVKLNDQHSFLALEAGADLRVGDVVEFGISHPCTCLDRHRFVFGLDETGRVRRVYPTYFG